MLFKIAKVLLITLVFFSFFVFFIGKKLDVTQEATKADIIICLGGGYVERLDKGIELYKERFASKIIFTGNLIGALNAKDKLGFWKVNYFKEHGVLKHHFSFLENTHDTHEEIKSIKKYMLKHHYKKVLIVSDPPHSKRINYLIKAFEYKKNGLSAKIIGSDVLWWTRSDYCDTFWSIKESIYEILGNIYYYIKYMIFHID